MYSSKSKWTGKKFNLEPGEKRQFSWTVTAEDKLYNRLILVRVYLYQKVAFGPAKTAHCGIIVWDFYGLSSNQIIAIAITASLILMVTGARLWLGRKNLLKDWSDNRLLRRLTWLTVFVTAGMVVNLLGYFIIAGIIYLFTLVVLLTMFEMLMYTK